MEKQVLSADRLRDDIRSCGLAAGDIALVHSSLRGIGHLSDGPATLIAAFQDILTRCGTLVMPAFTYDYGQDFNVRSSRPMTGLLCETFMNAPDVVRSCHPTHLVCAWENRAWELCEGHEMTEPFGAGSPLRRLMEWGG